MAGSGNPSNVYQQSAQGLQQAGTAAAGASQYKPASLGGRGFNQYMNPYQSQVINPAMQEIEKQRQMGINSVGAQATGAGAFGGSRHGVAEALTNEAALDATAATSGQLYSQGFNQAQSTANQDIQNQMAAHGLNLSGASQLGNLSNLGFGMGQTISGQQSQQGLQQQSAIQRLIDSANQQFSGFSNSPAASTQAPLQAIGGVPYGQTSTTESTPGLFDYLSLGMGFL